MIQKVFKPICLYLFMKVIIGSKKMGGHHGKCSKSEDKIIKLLGREVCVVVYEYESGLQRSACYFADKDPTHLRRRNTQLLRQVFELENKLKEEGKSDK